MTQKSSSARQRPQKSERDRFWFANHVAYAMLCIAAIGIFFGTIAVLASDPGGGVLLGLSLGVFTSALIPWVLSRMGEQQRDHFQRVERHLGIGDEDESISFSDAWKDKWGNGEGES